LFYAAAVAANAAEIAHFGYGTSEIPRTVGNKQKKYFVLAPTITIAQR
jgi:hypothetical protein